MVVGDGRQADFGINPSRGIWYFICTKDGPAQLPCPVWRPEMIVFILSDFHRTGFNEKTRRNIPLTVTRPFLANLRPHLGVCNFSSRLLPQPHPGSPVAPFTRHPQTRIKYLSGLLVSDITLLFDKPVMVSRHPPLGSLAVQAPSLTPQLVHVSPATCHNLSLFKGSRYKHSNPTSC
jgi:hypothetical protein